MNAGQAFWIQGVLVGAAVVLVMDPFPPTSTVVPAAPVPAWVTDPSPVRHPSFEPRLVVAGYTYRCNDCHTIIPSPRETWRRLTQHTDIRLDHGLNTRCFNCHHPDDRDAFVDDFGQAIPWDQPQRLCARCHGPVYRDWQNGSHGRIDGYWDTSRGRQTRRKCIECHDPHDPPFAPLKPAPGPNTLRMGPPVAPAHDGPRDPLRVHATHSGAGSEP